MSDAIPVSFAQSHRREAFASSPTQDSTVADFCSICRSLVEVSVTLRPFKLDGIFVSPSELHR
jgi:hypothetical protein